MHYKRKNGGCQGIIMHKETKTDSAGAKKSSRMRCAYGCSGYNDCSGYTDGSPGGWMGTGETLPDEYGSWGDADERYLSDEYESRRDGRGRDDCENRGNADERCAALPV